LPKLEGTLKWSFVCFGGEKSSRRQRRLLLCVIPDLLKRNKVCYQPREFRGKLAALSADLEAVGRLGICMSLVGAADSWTCALAVSEAGFSSPGMQRTIETMRCPVILV